MSTIISDTIKNLNKRCVKCIFFFTEVCEILIFLNADPTLREKENMIMDLFLS